MAWDLCPAYSCPPFNRLNKRYRATQAGCDQGFGRKGQIDKANAAGIHITHLDGHMDTIVSSEELLKVYLPLRVSTKYPRF